MNSGANLVGICWDKTFSIGGTGRTFHSNAELRAYQKENEGWETVSTKDRAWKDRLDIHRDKADKMFQKAGFKDKEHWSQISKREKAKGGDWVRGG